MAYAFNLTPSNLDDYDWVFRDPINGLWTVPIMEFNPQIMNPFYYEIDPLNYDKQYQDRMVNVFYTKLTEKWLYHGSKYKDLFKYFLIKKKDDKGTVTLVSDLDKLSNPSEMSESDGKYILKYIEKWFITKRFVEKTLREYVNTNRIKWYDLYANSSILKDLFRHKLKKIIIKTIHQLNKDKK